MLTFWGLLEESDIESYAASLLLPEYMSHLRRSPFHFDDQPPNPDGRQSLVVVYLGEGRIEEYVLKPRKHAAGLLHSVCPAMNPASIRIPPEESVWNWSTAFTKKSKNAPDAVVAPTMRLFFEAVFSPIPPETAPSFDPAICHVSVSRREMLLGRSVLQHYFNAWLTRLEGRETISPDALEIEPIAEGWQFQGDRIGGRFFLQEGDVFRDLLAYAGLARPLGDVADLVEFDFESTAAEIADDGIRFHLNTPGTKFS